MFEEMRENVLRLSAEKLAVEAAFARAVNDGKERPEQTAWREFLEEEVRRRRVTV